MLSFAKALLSTNECWALVCERGVFEGTVDRKPHRRPCTGAVLDWLSVVLCPLTCISTELVLKALNLTTPHTRPSAALCTVTSSLAGTKEGTCLPCRVIRNWVNPVCEQ